LKKTVWKYPHKKGMKRRVFEQGKNPKAKGMTGQGRSGDGGETSNFIYEVQLDVRCNLTH